MSQEIQQPIKLHKTDYLFLLQLISLRVRDSLVYKLEGDYYIITATRGVIEEILDELSEVLSEKGFNENLEPNVLGRMIESLIDKFSENIYE